MASKRSLNKSIKKVSKLSIRFLEEYMESNDENAYEQYSAIQDILEHFNDHHIRPHYPPVKREEYVFSGRARSGDYLLEKGFEKRDGVYSKIVPLFDQIDAWIRIPEKDMEGILEKDPYDYITVIDDHFGQPYGPFYIYYSQTVTTFPFLQKVIMHYNQKMSNLGIFKKKKEVLS